MEEGRTVPLRSALRSTASGGPPCDEPYDPLHGGVLEGHQRSELRSTLAWAGSGFATLLESHPLPEVRETGIAAKGIHPRVDIQVRNAVGAVVERVVQPVERRAVFPEGDVRDRDLVGARVDLARDCFDLGQERLGLRVAARLGVRVGQEGLEHGSVL